MREVIEAVGAPRAIGPYSQAIVEGGWVWVSGQIGLDPATGQLVEGGVEAQARRALANLGAILQQAGSSFGRVVRATVYLTDLEDFGRVNRIWAEHFPAAAPARACVEVARLPRGACIEIDAVAAR